MKIIVKTEKQNRKIWICHYCENDIGEKEVYYDYGFKKWYHRTCMDKCVIELTR